MRFNCSMSQDRTKPLPCHMCLGGLPSAGKAIPNHSGRGWCCSSTFLPKLNPQIPHLPVQAPCAARPVAAMLVWPQKKGKLYKDPLSEQLEIPLAEVTERSWKGHLQILKRSLGRSYRLRSFISWQFKNWLFWFCKTSMTYGCVFSVE